MTKTQTNSMVKDGIAVDLSEFQQVIINDVRRYLKTTDQNFRPRKYSSAQIKRFLDNPAAHERQLREVSHWLMTYSTHYQKVLGYFSSLFTLDSILAPVSSKYSDLTGTGIEVFRRNFERSSKYLENFNIKHELGLVMKILLSDGIYFGYERQQGNSFMLQRLPANYCKVIGKTDGIWSFVFNFDYFAGNQKELDIFPEEFRELYGVSVSNRKINVPNPNWIELDSDKAVCMKFFEELDHSVPPYVALFDDIMDLEDYKDMNKSKTKLDNYKLIIQKIPMKKDPKSEKDYVLTLPTVTSFHEGVKGAVPEQVGVISTPMDLTDIDFDKARQKEDNVGNAERNVFNSAAVSQSLFNADKSGSIGLERSIDFDTASTAHLLKQFERFFRKRLTQINNATHPFKLIMPEITIYNKLELFDKYLAAAQSGMPTKLYAAACLGISTVDFVSLASFENDFLNLIEVMIPLASSHTQSGDGTGGRPQKNTKKLSDSGLATRDKNKNQNRAKTKN